MWELPREKIVRAFETEMHWYLLDVTICWFSQSELDGNVEVHKEY